MKALKLLMNIILEYLPLAAPMLHDVGLEPIGVVGFRF